MALNLPSLLSLTLTLLVPLLAKPNLQIPHRAGVALASTFHPHPWSNSIKLSYSDPAYLTFVRMS